MPGWKTGMIKNLIWTGCYNFTWKKLHFSVGSHYPVGGTNFEATRSFFYKKNKYKKVSLKNWSWKIANSKRFWDSKETNRYSSSWNAFLWHQFGVELTDFPKKCLKVKKISGWTKKNDFHIIFSFLQYCSFYFIIKY